MGWSMVYQFYFHPTISKRVGGLKGFNVCGDRGLDVNGILAISSSQGNSRSLIFLIAFA